MNLPPQIGRFRVLGYLGKGAMGVVYRGRDEALERDVALKVMLIGQGDEDARWRFEREAKAAARLQHPNIVTIYELGTHESSPFMALELLEGVDLQRAIEAGLRPNPRVTLPIVLQLLSGLQHAHENGIVHRDVKPSNLFLPQNRPVKIMDFGVARLAGGMTTAGMVVGTPNYMSPEQVRAAPTIDGRSDLFSAGLILYELVTGEKAYRADSVVSLLYKIAHEDPDLSVLPREPEWERVRLVLARALDREPDERYPDARTMMTELAIAYAELGGSADWSAAVPRGLVARATPRPSPVFLGTPAPAPLAAPVALGTVIPESAVPTLPPPAPDHRRWIQMAALVAGVSVVGLVVGLFLLLWSGTPAPPSTAAAGVRPASGAAVSMPVGPPPPGPTSLLTAAPSPTPSAATPVRPPPTPGAGRSPTPAPMTTLVASGADVGAAHPPEAATPRPVRTPAVLAIASPAAPTGGQTPEVTETEPTEVSPSDARLERANDLLERGQFLAAQAEARAVLRREPGNPKAKALLEDAEAQLVVETRIRRAREALKRGDKDAALEEIKAGLAVNKSDARLIALFKEATQ